jgi:hypothetical protein
VGAALLTHASSARAAQGCARQAAVDSRARPARSGRVGPPQTHARSPWPTPGRSPRSATAPGASGSWRRCPAGAGLLSTLQVHISLAHPHEPFLLAQWKARGPSPLWLWPCVGPSSRRRALLVGGGAWPLRSFARRPWGAPVCPDRWRRAQPAQPGSRAAVPVRGRSARTGPVAQQPRSWRRNAG